MLAITVASMLWVQFNLGVGSRLLQSFDLRGGLFILYQLQHFPCSLLSIYLHMFLCHLSYLLFGCTCVRDNTSAQIYFL